ncbi:MAG: DsrE family protein [Chlorobi bacterium]|nr:DsrE family protein [Chlorobiota bacterium]MCI0717157.1 DsrE family protein [Chlorobiota bacterium]
MTELIIIHDAPYGNEKAYNALRHAMKVQAEHKDVKVTVFLMADAVGCVIKAQKTPQGYYNIERMIQYVIRNGGEVKLCGTCLDARGISESLIFEGASRSTMSEFTNLTLSSDKVISF